MVVVVARGRSLSRSVLVVSLFLPLAVIAPDVGADIPGVGCLPDLPCQTWASRLPVGPANEIHVAVNPLDSNHFLLVGKDYGLGASQVCRPGGAFSVASASYVTFDGGATWSTGRVPAPYPNGGAEPSPLPYKCGSDPVAAFGPDGTAYYILLNFDYDNGRKAGIAVARSPDGGLTWPASEIRLLHTSPGDDKEWGAVDRDGRVHVVWSDLSSRQILYSRTPDPNAFAFSAPIALASVGSGNPAVTVATGPSGEVYVLWRDGSSIRMRASQDSGASFAPTRVAFNVNPWESGVAPRLPFMPQLAVDANPSSAYAGRLYVVWPGNAGFNDANVMLSSSGDGGITWTAPLRIDDARVASAQVMPTVSVAPNGRVDVAWMDGRDTRGLNVQGYPSWRTYATSSADAGATWRANVAVSDVPLVSAWSRHQNGDVFIGDYMGIVSTNDAAWPAYSANGAERLAQGLPANQFQRADAYLGRLPADLAAPLGVAAPQGTVASMELPATLAHPDVVQQMPAFLD